MLERLTIPQGWPLAIACGLALALSLGALLSGYRWLRETTLLPAWMWAIVAINSLGITQIAASFSPVSGPSTSLSPLEWAIATLTFCPAIALLGAMRPQHAYWNFIVGSAWLMLALPAAETYFMNPGQRLEVGDARAWFLWLMIALGPINFLATRFWLGSLLLALGQIVIFSSDLPLIAGSIGASPITAGFFIMVAAALSAFAASHYERKATNPFDALWLEFRDAYGMLWGLRFAERVNSAAAMYGWDFSLRWEGFRHNQTGESPFPAVPDVDKTLRNTLHGIVRRFFSTGVIALRLGNEVN